MMGNLHSLERGVKLAFDTKGVPHCWLCIAKSALAIRKVILFHETLDLQIAKSRFRHQLLKPTSVLSPVCWIEISSVHSLFSKAAGLNLTSATH